MEKINKYILSLVLIATVLLSVSTVMAADVLTVTIDSPVANGMLYGVSTDETAANISVTVDDAASNFNCTVFAQSATSGNSTWVVLINGTTDAISNESDTVWNATFETAMIEDASDYIINVTCFNGTTADYGESTNTGIIINNGVPIAASSLYPTGLVTNRTFTFGGTVTDANTTSCTLRFDGINPGQSSYTGTYSTTSCTYSATLVPEQTYRFYIRASDGSNTTDSSVSTVTIDVGTGAGRSMTPQQIQEAKAKGLLAAGWTIGDVTIPIWAIVLTILVVVIMYIVIKKK